MSRAVAGGILLAGIVLGGPPVAPALDLPRIFDRPDPHEWKKVAHPASAKEISRLGFDEEIVARLNERTGAEAELFPGDRPKKDPPTGLVWPVGSAAADEIVRTERVELGAKGYVIFLAERSFGTAPDRVAVLRDGDAYAPVKVQRTAGPNVQVSNADVLAKLREWETRIPFDLIGAGRDWIEIEFRAVPPRLEELVEEIRALAPDSLGRGDEGLESLRAEIERSRRVMLWWE